MNHLKLRRIIVPAAAIGLCLATSAVAADTFNACFKNSTSKVRSSSVLVNSTPVCKLTETLRTWNEEGPQGPPGLSNCSPEEFAGSCNANTFAVLNSSCSGTRKAVSASAIWHTPFDAADNGPFYILPRTSQTWTVVPYNHTGTQQDFRFFLQCCD